MLGKYCENEKFYNIYCSSWNYNRNVQRLFNQNMQFRAGYHHNAKFFQFCSILSPDLHILPRALSDLKPDELAFDRRRNEM